MVALKGLEKFAPKDFPGFISSTVFLGGCNFNCPYCHNSDLVQRPHELPTIPMDFFLCYLDSRRDWLDGVCISGGEPLLEPDLEELLSLLKDRNLRIKIDTNGSFPERLESLIESNLVDWIAMDVKAPLEKYRDVTRSEVQKEDIASSVEIIRNSGLNYMFRTTVVPGLLSEEDIIKISEWLSGSRILQIQQFSPTNTLDREFLNVQPYRREEIEKFAELARPFFSEIRMEGI
ncbi:MAG: anaerobic ribonucleoside-triphosphate reductase activating protein [Candidatus Aminicenantales bacterium]